jgi:signal transduction histidine kinase
MPSQPAAAVQLASAAHSPRSERLIDSGIAMLVFAASVALLAAGDDVDVLGLVLTALATLPLVARRSAPMGVFVVTAFASTAVAAIATPAGPPLGPTLALYWVAASGEQSRQRAWLTAALVVTLLVAHATAGGLADDRFPDTELLFGVLVWGGAWIAGDRARLRRERMAELEERALRAEREAEREAQLAAAEERTRIARDLHDSAGHAINVILVHAGAARLRTDSDPEARETFETIEQVARETVGEIDELVGALRDDRSRPEPERVEPPLGLAALAALVERHRAAGLEVATRSYGDPRPLSPAADRAAYRILQEALTNAARHGNGGAEVDVRFGTSELELTVVNRLVRGETAPADGGGHGIVGMRERAALLGGSFAAGARDDRFRVHARLPLEGGG